MQKMRIVGYNPGTKVIIQRQKKSDQWEQFNLSISDFEKMMIDEFPEYYKEYKKSGTEKKIDDYFYHYGETRKMILKGESFIYTA